MNSEQMADCIAFMQLMEPAGALRIQAEGRNAFFYWTTWGWPGCKAADAALAACELQCIVEAMRAERLGGVFIGVKS